MSGGSDNTSGSGESCRRDTEFLCRAALVLCLLGTCSLQSSPYCFISPSNLCTWAWPSMTDHPNRALSRHLSELHGARTRANRSLRSYVPDKYVLILPPIGTHQCNECFPCCYPSHPLLTPTYPNAPTSSTPPAYSSPQSRPPKKPHPESHTLYRN